MSDSSRLVRAFLATGRPGTAILDSCGIGVKRSLLIAASEPVETLSFDIKERPDSIFEEMQKAFSMGLAAIFTISYDFGHALEPRLSTRIQLGSPEPAVFVALYDRLLVHDYHTRRSCWKGGNRVREPYFAAKGHSLDVPPIQDKIARSNFSRESYCSAVELIKERIRRGDTYQVNLTQKIEFDLESSLSSAEIFLRLRQDNPSQFAAYIDRGESQVVSTSPESFFRTSRGRIEASPIKGTRPRGGNRREDMAFRQDLAQSAKDRAENTMIVDLLRNDLGRVCRYGSVRVEGLCEIEAHPTLFHLVSRVSGELEKGIVFADLLKALFPCGSITGAPKIRTMEIIDDIEQLPRGLSMGAIGYFIPESGFDMESGFDLSVAIRTMVARGRRAEFNVGGGVVIDSDGEAEYKESLLKAKALLNAAGVTNIEPSTASS